MSKPLVIKIPVVGKSKTEFSRDAWFGYGPFKGKVNADGSLKIKLGDADSQTLTSATTEYGPYFMADFLGGKAFVTEVQHEKYGHYLRLKLTDDVVLPDETLAQIAGPNKAANAGQAKEAAAPKTETKVEDVMW